MCTISGLAQGWWSVAGLSSDIFGFSLLALDVGREYLRHKRVEQLEEAARSAEWLSQDNHRVPDTLGEDDATLKVARKELCDLRRRLRQQEIRMTELALQGWGDEKPTGNLEEKALIFRTLAKQQGMRPFKRAPIFTGVVFVLLGFALQVIGSIPCT